MTFYLTVSQLPELAGLTRKQRYEVYKRCLHPWLRSWPLLVVRSVLAPFLFYFGMELVLLHGLWTLVLFIGFYCALDHLLDMAAISLLRPHRSDALRQCVTGVMDADRRPHEMRTNQTAPTLP